MPSPNSDVPARPDAIVEALPAVVTAKDIQRILAVSRPMAYEVLAQLPEIRVGRLRRALGADLLKWLETQRTAWPHVR
jgi:hypothetical protein